MLKNINIGTKIGLAVALLIALAVIMGGTASYKMSRVSRDCEVLQQMVGSDSDAGQARKAVAQAGESLSTAAAQTNIGLVIIGLLGIATAYLLTTSVTAPFKNIIKELQQGAGQVTSAAGQVAASSASLAQGSTEQAAGLEETSSSLEEMSSVTRQSADNAQQANLLATEASQAADSGSTSMNRMNEAIHDIEKSAGETAKIIKVIDEIAFQTNLLALNAAVEAARAGEAGKGFAVVAEEVRNLAKRSAEAARNTASLIEESVRKSQTGTAISSEVAEGLTQIVASISQTSELVNEISASAGEQAQGIDQVNTTMAQLDQLTQSNAANAEQSASAAEELSNQAHRMQNMVEQLSALVGKAAQKPELKAAKSVRPAAAPPKKEKRPHLMSKPKIQAPEQSQRLADKAAEMIPFDEDEDLEAFNS